MKIEKYNNLVKELPATGRVINAYQENENIAVYQAYRKSIADFAVNEQFLGGSDFSLNRMSWIKTSFLWMMFRSGWGQKEGQEHILQLWIPKTFFDKILGLTVISSFSNEFYSDQEHWKKELLISESRLQWDPDHDPFGKPISRKAIQLGLKGSLLKEFATSAIVKINDITPFVQEQFNTLAEGGLSGLQVPHESIYQPTDRQLIDRIKLNN